MGSRYELAEGPPVVQGVEVGRNRELDIVSVPVNLAGFQGGRDRHIFKVDHLLETSPLFEALPFEGLLICDRQIVANLRVGDG
jgi:hypothetical protein